jgi:uncharacterized Zn finger protein (UPF0148 family)
MTTKHCQACGTPFYVTADDHWKTLCLPCWKRTKRAEAQTPAWTPADSRLLRLALEVEDLTAENAGLRAKLAEAKIELMII